MTAEYALNLKTSILITSNTRPATLASVNDKANRDKFHIKAVILGVFTYDPEVKKELIHVETYKELFPYARAMISSLTVNAGIPPVIIPNFDIESQCIYKFGKNC